MRVNLPRRGMRPRADLGRLDRVPRGLFLVKAAVPMDRFPDRQVDLSEVKAELFKGLAPTLSGPGFWSCWRR